MAGNIACTGQGKINKENLLRLIVAVVMENETALQADGRICVKVGYGARLCRDIDGWKISESSALRGKVVMLPVYCQLVWSLS